MLSSLGTEPATLVIFLAGSFLRGQAGPTSDVDLYVIVDSRFRQRRQVVTSSGVLVEIFLNPEGESRRQFREENYQAMHMIGYGLIDRYEDALDVLATDPARAASPAKRKDILDQVLRHVLGPEDSLKIEPWESVPEDVSG